MRRLLDLLRRPEPAPPVWVNDGRRKPALAPCEDPECVMCAVEEVAR